MRCCGIVRSLSNKCMHLFFRITLRQMLLILSILHRQKKEKGITNLLNVHGYENILAKNDPKVPHSSTGGQGQGNVKVS